MKKIFLFLALILTVTTAEAAARPKKAVQKQPSEAELAKKKNDADFRAAENQLYGGRLQIALPELERLCDAGYLRACSLLGFGYYAGRYGIEQNTQTGINWYEKCAEQEKNFFCHKELGRIYSRMGDYVKALDYFKKGAVGSDAESQYRLALMYRTGKGVPPDYEKALKWMRKAAHARKSPSKAAQCALVEMSYFGIGMRRSMKDTKYWLTLCDNAQVRALMSFFGHGVSKDKQKAKAVLEQAELKEMLADWNDLNGQSRPSVGVKTLRDQGVSEDCLNTSRKGKKITTYAVKIFDEDFYRTFDIHDGYIEKSGIGDQTFEACGTTYYMTVEQKRLLNSSLKKRDVIKIGRYNNACLSMEMTGVCDLNLSWREEGNEDE